MEGRMNGVVKWFHSSKGYGFIIGEDNKEYFAHYTKILGEGFKNLLEGQKVTFNSQPSPKGNGTMAVDIEAQ